MPDEDSPRETRLREMAARQGLFLGKSRPSDRGGGYMLFDDPEHASAVFGASADKRSPLDISGNRLRGTLDEIEAFLIRGQERDRSERP